MIARSAEAKAIGIPMGAPAFKIKDIVEKNNVILFSSNYMNYGDLSSRVMSTLRKFAVEMEIYSIDEAFLNLAGLLVELEDYAQTIQKTTLKNVGIPVSVGVGPTKVLAKVANHIAKKVSEKQGICVLNTQDKIQEALMKLEIESVWGIGQQYANLLKSVNVKTAWDFTQMCDDWVRKRMTVVGLRVKKELEGISCLEMELVPQAKKMICTSRSFGESQTELEPIQEAVATFAARCASKLRKQRSCAGRLMVFIHTNGFKPDEPQYEKKFVCKLPVETNSTMEITRYALAALNAIYIKGYRYKKAGVVLFDIVPETSIQGSLFDNVNRPKHDQIMKTLDQINSKYGRDTLKLAVQGSGKKWGLRQEKLSPCYTTRWEDILTIKV